MASFYSSFIRPWRPQPRTQGTVVGWGLTQRAENRVPGVQSGGVGPTGTPRAWGGDCWFLEQPRGGAIRAALRRVAVSKAEPTLALWDEASAGVRQPPLSMPWGGRGPRWAPPPPAPPAWRRLAERPRLCPLRRDRQLSDRGPCWGITPPALPPLLQGTLARPPLPPPTPFPGEPSQGSPSPAPWGSPAVGWHRAEWGAGAAVPAGGSHAACSWSLAPPLRAPCGTRGALKGGTGTALT